MKVDCGGSMKIVILCQSCQWYHQWNRSGRTYTYQIRFFSGCWLCTQPLATGSGPSIYIVHIYVVQCHTPVVTDFRLVTRSRHTPWIISVSHLKAQPIYLSTKSTYNAYIQFFNYRCYEQTASMSPLQRSKIAFYFALFCSFFHAFAENTRLAWARISVITWKSMNKLMDNGKCGGNSVRRLTLGLFRHLAPLSLAGSSRQNNIPITDIRWNWACLIRIWLWYFLIWSLNSRICIWLVRISHWRIRNWIWGIRIWIWCLRIWIWVIRIWFIRIWA